MRVGTSRFVKRADFIYMKLIRVFGSLLALTLLTPFAASAELAVKTLPLRVATQKAIVPILLKNNFGQKIESARATVFLLNENGKMIGQATRWVIGETKNQPGLEPGKEATFNFVVQANAPFTTTNLSAKVNFNRVVLEGGKLADVAKEVQVKEAAK